MKEFLGETILDIHKTEYAMYNKQDWVMLWIETYGQIDGSHHKDWLLDQIVRILKGTRVIIKLARWSNGEKEVRFSLDNPTQEYNDWASQICNGEDGANTYSYSIGIAP